MDLNALKSVHARDELEYLMHYVNHGLLFRDAFCHTVKDLPRGGRIGRVTA